MSQFKPTGGELLMISRMQDLKASQSEDALSIQKNVTFYNNQEVLCHQEQNIALTELSYIFLSNRKLQHSSFSNFNFPRLRLFRQLRLTVS